MKYRRVWIPGATYFFTVCLQDRKATLLTDYVDELRAAFMSVQRRYPYTILAISVMPDHLHALWRLPEGDSDFAIRWRRIKTEFTRQLPKRCGQPVWQKRFWEHCIRNEEDLRRHIDYIHINPVKHGYAQCASDWQFSSIHRDIRSGRCPKDWACEVELMGHEPN